jgi:GTP-binding protein
MDLPGYGYARASGAGRQKIQELINWYFFDSGVEPKYVVLIIDAEVGPTKDDLEMLLDLRKANKNILVVANKIDKIKKSIYKKHIESVERKMNFKILPFSALKKIGVESLFDILTLD